jgi:SAM-dependent methyltransferase
MKVETHIQYLGSELEIFALANRWKSYVALKLKPYIQGDVAEVGAGLGSTTRALCDPATLGEWLCLEPDEKMAGTLDGLRAAGKLPRRCRVRCGVLKDLSSEQKFDTIIYADVLEHIEYDQIEINEAASRLRDRGRLIILCPAHQHLFNQFDLNIGHYRRYDKKDFKKLNVHEAEIETLFYLDSVGYLASLANKILLRQRMPTKRQIIFWDRVMVTCSQRVDPILRWRAGKSIVGVWKKECQKTASWHESTSKTQGS